MAKFLLISLIASVILTVLVNLLPLLFPNAATKAQRTLEENARPAVEQYEDDGQPRVKVFFPWKAMILISVALTVLVNLVAVLAR